MRLLKAAENEMFSSIVPLLKKSDARKLVTAYDSIRKVCCIAEENMFGDLGYKEEYEHVFYGPLEGEPRSDIDGEVMQMARTIVRSLCEGKRKVE